MPLRQVPTKGRSVRDWIRNFEARVMDAAREARRPRLAEFARQIDGTVLEILPLLGSMVELRETRRGPAGSSGAGVLQEISRIYDAVGALLEKAIYDHAAAQSWSKDTERLLTPFGEEGEDVLEIVNGLAAGFPAALESLKSHGRTFPHYPPPATHEVANVNLFFLQNFGGPDDMERQLDALMPRDAAEPILVVYEANAGLSWLPVVVAHLSAITRKAEIQRGFWEIIGHDLHHTNALMGSGDVGKVAWSLSRDTAGLQLDTLQRVRANLARPAASAELV